MSDAARNLARNLRVLREARGFTQQRAADLAELPRPTWATLESGSGNPTLGVLLKVASALQVSVEELIGPPRATAEVFRVDELKTRNRGGVTVRSILPVAVPNLEVERMYLPPGARMTGVPHVPGTREVLTCEAGRIRLTVSGETFEIGAGEVVVFRGDQRHGYANAGDDPAVGYSVVSIAPPGM